MEPTVQITFRNMNHSMALEEDIKRRAIALARRAPRLSSCRVFVEAPSAHHRKGGCFHVRVELHVASGPALTLGPRDDSHAHPDAYLAVRDAFIAAGQRLTDDRRRQRARHLEGVIRSGTR
jgi:hypothetical protein